MKLISLAYEAVSINRKDTYAFDLCLLSNVAMLAIKYVFYCREINSQRVSTLVSIGALQLLTNVPIC